MSDRYRDWNVYKDRFDAADYGEPYNSPSGSRESRAYHGERTVDARSELPYDMRRAQNAPSPLGWRSGSYGGRREPEPAGPRRTYADRSGSFRSGSWGLPSNAGLAPLGYQRPDDLIQEEVNEALTEDPWVDACNITVSVAGGEVTLGGTVADRQQKRAAEDALGRIKGLVDIHNRLRIEQARQGSVLSGVASDPRS